MLSTLQKKDIKAAFLKGELKTKAVDPQTGAVGLHKISDIMKHLSPTKRILTVTTEDGAEVAVTEDHSLFHFCKGSTDYHYGPILEPVPGSDLSPGDYLGTTFGNECIGVPVVSITETDKLMYTYDLCVPGVQNFVLTNGIVCHNSYSIGGVSLDIERSSKYESLKQNAESQQDKALEAKKNTIFYMRGLSQPRFGLGVRSAFGPNLAKSLLSPRSFI